MTTKVVECDCFNCKWNSWRASASFVSAHKRARRKQSCTRSDIHISNGSCGNFQSWGK